MSKKTDKIETAGEMNIQESAENPLEARVANLETMLQQSVAITNNLITYCNTVEKWRKMDFIPPKDETAEGDSDGDAPTDKATKEPEEPVAA